MNPKTREKLGWIVAIALAILGLLTACGGQSNGVGKEAGQASVGINQILNNQPVEAFKYSQYRTEAQQIEAAQASTLQTTTFYFLPGVPNPIKVCLSVGYPIDSDTEISNPQQAVASGTNGLTSIGQMDPNGVYLGPSTGSYSECVRDDKALAIDYGQELEHTEAGLAKWDPVNHQIVDYGDPDFKFTKTTGDTRAYDVTKNADGSYTWTLAKNQ
jgi:hypothetical protein